MPWFDRGGKKVFYTEEALRRMEERSSSVGGAVPTVRGSKRLTDENKYALFLQTGRNFDTLGEVESYCRSKGTHILEPGDAETKALERIKEQEGDYGKEIEAARKAGNLGPKKNDFFLQKAKGKAKGDS